MKQQSITSFIISVYITSPFRLYFAATFLQVFHQNPGASNASIKKSTYRLIVALAPQMADQNIAALPPVVFKWPGLSPDICLKVFYQEYHVRSVLLKLHSAFFRAFLDSPDKQSSEKALAHGFQYEGVTEV